MTLSQRHLLYMDTIFFPALYEVVDSIKMTGSEVRESEEGSATKVGPGPNQATTL